MLKSIITTVGLLLFSNIEIPTERRINTLVDVEITIKKIKNAKGKLLIGVFKDNSSFEKEKAFKSIISTKETLSNGVIKVKTQLEPGIYGASLLDDEMAFTLLSRAFSLIARHAKCPMPACLCAMSFNVWCS